MKLNLGCGEMPIPGYVNVDMYLPADVKGDIRELEFEGVEEVLMSHLLEHLPWTQTIPVLRRIRGWMVDDALIRVEVPDMQAIMEVGEENPNWVLYIYGNQAHEGEVHRAGFTIDSLHIALVGAGFRSETIAGRRFLSSHMYRIGMPCIEMEARA